MVTDLRSAVEWLTTVRCWWSIEELADLAGAKLDRAQYYATRLEHIGVLLHGTDGRYAAGPASATWRKVRPKSRGIGGNAVAYRRQREVRETLRAREWQALRAGAALTLPEAQDEMARVAARERLRIGATGNRLTCNEAPQGDSRHPEGPEVPLAALVSPRDAAAQLGVCENTVLRAISRGDLPAIRLGPRLLRIKESDIVAYLERGAQRLKEKVRG